MLILLDLDGVLTNTTEPEFKKYKDGIEDFYLDIIPVMDGAIDFINRLKAKNGVKIAVLSDSHPRYVQRIVTKFFDVPFLSLADKPNISKTKSFIQDTFGKIDNFDRRAIMVGDSSLDIELARGMGISSIYTRLYEFKSIDFRDGLGNIEHAYKSGPTFEARSFNEIEDILARPRQNLLCLEAFFANDQSSIWRELSSIEIRGKLKTIISLGRQQQGSCDRFGLINIYNEFQKLDRNPEALATLAKGINHFLSQFLGLKKLNNPIITYIPEKSTTSNSKKMVEILDKLETKGSLQCLFRWEGNINSSTKQLAHKFERTKFLQTHLKALNEPLHHRDIIVLDDQYTTGATAEVSINKLWEMGANNIYFVSFFYLINNVATDCVCPKCGKYFQIKVRKKDGVKFLSCPSPTFGGNGCGTIQNL